MIWYCNQLESCKWNANRSSGQCILLRYEDAANLHALHWVGQKRDGLSSQFTVQEISRQQQYCAGNRTNVEIAAGGRQGWGPQTQKRINNRHRQHIGSSSNVGRIINRRRGMLQLQTKARKWLFYFFSNFVATCNLCKSQMLICGAAGPQNGSFQLQRAARCGRHRFFRTSCRTSNILI